MVRVTNFLHPHSPKDDPVKSPRWFPYGPQINPMFFVVKAPNNCKSELGWFFSPSGDAQLFFCCLIQQSNSCWLSHAKLCFFLFIPYTTIYLQMTNIYKHDDWTTLQNGGFSSCFIPAWCDLSPHPWEIVRPLWIFRQNRSNERIFAHPPGGWWDFTKNQGLRWISCGWIAMTH